MRSAPISLAVHPLQVYFGVLSLGLGAFTPWLARHKRYDDQVFLAHVTLYGCGQFLLEFLRFKPLPNVQYLAGALAVVAGATWLARAGRPPPAQRTCVPSSLANPTTPEARAPLV